MEPGLVVHQTKDAQTECLYAMLGMARSISTVDNTVLQEAMHRVIAILSDALRLVDLDYGGEDMIGPLY